MALHLKREGINNKSVKKGECLLQTIKQESEEGEFIRAGALLRLINVYPCQMSPKFTIQNVHIHNLQNT